ncbi:MAG: prepilin peptidase [Patescibacteria group bacterium]
MQILLGFYFFILGLIIGSFLNVVVLRLKNGLSIMNGRSKCPNCKHVLGVLDLVPLFSFLFIGGKCRYCKKKISWQYFLVELTTAFIFTVVYVYFGLSFLTLFYLVISAFLIVIFIYDFKYYLILDKIIVPAIILAFLGNLFLEPALGRAWWELLIGGAIGGGLFLMQFMVSKGKWIGGGDIRLGLFMGLLLGWKLVLVALFISYLLGSFVGMFLLLKKRKKMQDALPFGTFLTISTFIVLIYGQVILNWYLSFLYL